jgi:uncharacterized protein (TIGR02186 family)
MRDVVSTAMRIFFRPLVGAGSARAAISARRSSARLRVRMAMLAAALATAVIPVLAGGSTLWAQVANRKRPAPVAKEVPNVVGEAVRKQLLGARESVEADVSARNVAVTASFSGVEIVVFGAVDNSQQPSPESGYYDVIIVVEGVPGRIVVRRKSDVTGLWVNTSAVTFDNVPTFFAIASTRPLDEIASEDFRTLYRIGVRHLRLTPAFVQSRPLSTQELDAFREAVARLKERAGLFVNAPFATRFIGNSLFSARIVLPANVTVGPFDTRVYLFHDQTLLSEYSVRLYLEREGLARYLHAFAELYPLLYGLSTVALSLAAGLLAGKLFGGAAS